MLNAANLNDLFVGTDTTKSSPCIAGRFVPGQEDYFLIHNTATGIKGNAAAEFAAAEKARAQLASRSDVRPPKSFLKPLGGFLTIAAGPFFEDPS